MSQDPNTSDQPKIVVDEDWKSRVEAEKQAYRAAEQAQGGPQAGGPPPLADHDPVLPKPTLEFLVSTLALQTSVALGMMPDPVTGKRQVRLNQARHFIDTIEMLYEKTTGNRTEDETAAIDHLLHELRLDYVAVAERVKTP